MILLCEALHILITIDSFPLLVLSFTYPMLLQSQLAPLLASYDNDDDDDLFKLFRSPEQSVMIRRRNPLVISLYGASYSIRYSPTVLQRGYFVLQDNLRHLTKPRGQNAVVPPLWNG